MKWNERKELVKWMEERKDVQWVPKKEKKKKIEETGRIA